ncbi:hypothetical protein JRQ81_012288, partial [Phrynocephalus forsythii]
GIPIDNRLCVCGNPALEDLAHYVLDCPLYSNIREKFLQHILKKVENRSISEKLSFLLQTSNLDIINRVAIFAFKAAICRAKYLDGIGVKCYKDSEV